MSTNGAMNNDKWIKPAILIALAGMIFSAGGTYYKVDALEASVKEREIKAFQRALRINTLENNYTHIQKSLGKITDYIEERRKEREKVRNIRPERE